MSLLTLVHLNLATTWRSKCAVATAQGLEFVICLRLRSLVAVSHQHEEYDSRATYEIKFSMEDSTGCAFKDFR